MLDARKLFVEDQAGTNTVISQFLPELPLVPLRSKRRKKNVHSALLRFEESAAVFTVDFGNSESSSPVAEHLKQLVRIELRLPILATENT
jgi:hypothetical protein